MATQTRYPTGDGDTYLLGGTTQIIWASSGALWECVDETSVNNDTDYIYMNKDTTQLGAAISGVYSLYTATAFSPASGSTISKLEVMVTARIENASYTVSCQPCVKVNGTRYTATASTLSSSYATNTGEWTTNPNTSASWTVADISGSGSNPLQQFGAVVNFNSKFSVPRITQVYAVVTYTEPVQYGVGGGVGSISTPGNYGGWI